jgi:8-oxo-dGTP diphosphatase/2-hydroxy-dATP diphosphatase
MPPPGLSDDLKEYHAGGTGDWFAAAEIRYYTNVFLVHDDKLLLGYKKRGLGIHKSSRYSHRSPGCSLFQSDIMDSVGCSVQFFISVLIFSGGKVEPGESTLDAALRELKVCWKFIATLCI